LKKRGKMANESMKVLKGLGYVVLSLILGGLVIWGALFLIDHLPTALKNAGATVTQTPINDTGIFGKVMKVVLGITAPLTYEKLILFLAIFVIILFGLADIIMVFSTFSDATAWVIAFGLAIIAGVTKGIYAVAGIFSLTSGIGALGIAIIILMTLICAVLMNFFIGKAGIRNAMDAQKDQKAISKAARNMRRGYGFLKAGSDIVGGEE
jgi:hypothetical protein